MKRIIPFAATLLMLLPLVACQDEFVPGQGGEEWDGVGLRFVLDGIETKSDESLGLPQERRLNSIDVYFYPDGETSNDAVFHWRKDLQECYTTFNAHIDFLSSEVQELFHSSATCEVLAIANMPASELPGNDTPLTGSSMPTLLAKKVQSVFGSAADTDHIPESFVMVGTNTIALTSRAQTTVATGTVPLYRLAAKLELLVHVQDTVHLRTTWKDDDTGTVYIAEEIWRPMTQKQGTTAQVEAYLENGYKEAALGVREDPASHMVQISTTTPMTPALTAMFFKYSKNKMPYDSGTTVTISENKRWTYSDYQAGQCSLEQVGYNATDPVTGETVTINNVYMYSDPSYTYPETWSRGVEKEPFFKLCFPWSRDSKILVYKNGLNQAPVQENYKSAQKQYYYKIMFPVNALEPNHFYRFKINVAILGSETDDALVTMTPTYAVAGWQNKTEVLEEAEVGNARYLSVPQSAYTLYNEPTLSIPYVTSDECKIVDVSWYKPYYGTKNIGATEDGGTISSGSAYGYSKITGGSITLNSTGVSTDGNWEFKLSDDKTIDFKHLLKNEQSATMDVSPYYITFTICHADLDSYFKIITITQYPAIYMEYVTGGSVFVDGYFAQVKNATMTGARAIDSYTQDGVTYSGYYTSLASNSTTWNTSAGGNITTPYLNLYRQTVPSQFSLLDITKLTVSAFTSSANTFRDHSGSNVEYIIGDPRQNSGWTSSNLTNYLYSITGNNTKNTRSWTDADKIKIGTTQTRLIAPSLLFSSAWSAKSGNVSFSDATKRCATYQEAGYPAGRWRLPTEAEVNFVQALQTYNKIPTLFASGAAYWTSSGYTYNGTSYTLSNSAVDSGVRCVYDSWYWGETPMDAATYHPNPE